MNKKLGNNMPHKPSKMNSLIATRKMTEGK